MYCQTSSHMPKSSLDMVCSNHWQLKSGYMVLHQPASPQQRSALWRMSRLLLILVRQCQVDIGYLLFPVAQWFLGNSLWLCKSEPSWAECMPVAWLIATGLLSLTDAFVAGLGDAILFLLPFADVDSSPSGGQVTDTANIDEVRLAYDEKSPHFAEWLPCIAWAVVVTAVTGLPVVWSVSASRCYQQPSLRTVWHHGGCVVDERHFLATALRDLAGRNSLGLATPCWGGGVLYGDSHPSLPRPVYPSEPFPSRPQKMGPTGAFDRIAPVATTNIPPSFLPHGVNRRRSAAVVAVEDLHRRRQSEAL